MPQRFLSIKNFEKYQHFKKSNPPWVKLYRSLFTDREFMRLPLPCKYLYIGLITLASEGCNKVFNDPFWISQRLAILPSEVDLKPLYRSGFLIASDSTVYRQTISQRRDREETETEREAAVAAHTPTLQKVVPRQKKQKTELPEGFTFNDRHKSIADGLGLNVHAECARFKDKALAKGYTYCDWDAAFRNWLSNSAEFKQARHA